MHERRRCSRKRPVPQLDELAAPRVALGRLCKDLLGLEIQKAQPHRPMAHDPLEVPDASTPAIRLARIERDRHVAAFAHALCLWVSPVPDTHAERPHADQLVQVSAFGSDPGSNRVGVVDDVNRRRDRSRRKRLGKSLAEVAALRLLQIGRLLDQAAANHPRKSETDRIDRMAGRDARDEVSDRAGDLVRRQKPELVDIVSGFGKDTQRRCDARAFHDTCDNVLGRHDSDCS